MNMMEQNADEQRSGDLMGHAVPAFFFASSGAAMLLLMLVRSRRGNHPAHFPEQNPRVLLTMGIYIVVATLNGILWEGVGGYLFCGNFFFQLAHQTLYLGFLLAGCTWILESKGRVPPDAGRVAASLALVICFLIFWGHGQMKSGKVDSTVHSLLACLHLTNAAAMAYSVKYPDSMFGALGSVGLLVATGVWMLTVGFWESRQFEMTMHQVHAIFSVEIILVAFVILGVGALGTDDSGEESEYHDGLNRADFGPLKRVVSDDDDEDLEDP